MLVLRMVCILMGFIDLRFSHDLGAVSALAAIVLLIVFRKCSKLSGCGSRRVMEANGIQLEEQSEQFDSGAESTILSGMSAEEAAQQVAVHVKKTAESEIQDAEAEEEQAEESEEKTDGSAN